MQQLNQVVKYILYRCRQNNTPITQIMAGFISQTIYNQRTDKFYLQDKLSQSEMRQLKEAAIKKIFNKQALDMKIITMQINYSTQFLQSQIKKQQQTKNQAIASGNLTDQVVNHEVKNAKDFQGLSQLYKKIYNYLLFKNKLVTEADKIDTNLNKIEKQVAAALQSVIPRAALAPFVTLNSSQKLVQLVQLSNLVLGIRLFNQQIGKGGAGLLKLSQLLNNNASQIKQQIFKQVEQIIDQSQRYTHIFKVYQNGKIQLQPTQLKRLKSQLIFIKQYKAYLLHLSQEIQISESTFDINGLKFDKQIDDLKFLLGSKSSAPKEQVYPKFALLAQAYVSIFEQGKYFTHKIKLYNLLKQFRKSFPLSLSSKFYQKISQIYLSLPSQNSHMIQIDPNSGIQMFSKQNSPDFEQKDCNFQGYCVWSLVKFEGLPISGDPNLGAFKYKDKHCVFSSVTAFHDYQKQPEYYLIGTIQQCRKNPELIYLLRLQQSFKNVNLSLINQAVEGGIKNKLMVDKMIQTPVHFIQKNIDPSYCWNEWELRKKAIQMANIRKTQTRGDQTILSNFKVDSDTQTFLKKDAETNTIKNSGTQYKAEKDRHDVGI